MFKDFQRAVRDQFDSVNLPDSVCRIRNTVIGTLLLDLSEGRDLESAVKSYEAKVAPSNYKRPTALITKGMVEKARKKVEELGFTDSLPRRYAVIDDITINNVLFASREAKAAMDVFDELATSIPVKTQKLGGAEEVPIDRFLTGILPGAETVEVMFENRQANNLVSLIAPVNPDAPTMFKWGNNFSHTYNGELADSMRQRVKNAGGNVEGDLRCSLSWFNTDDLDLHMVEPDGTKIMYSSKNSRRTGGNLDVDMNAGNPLTTKPVENICYPRREKMAEGRYKLSVHQFSRRNSDNVGFDCEIEFDGTIYSFSYDKLVKGYITVAEFNYSHKDGIKIVKGLKSDQATKKVWNIDTQKLHKVDAIMFSPNYWDGNGIGNRHVFFMLEDCKNDGPARGFFNEFLTEELSEHRKVFEVLGSKMKAPESDEQLSGLGFSTTQRNHVYCRVTGESTRLFKVIF